MAQEEGITLGDKQAETLYKQYHAEEGELSDSELDNVAGGCSTAADYRKEGKYMETVPTSACYAFQWSYDIWNKDGQKMCCMNCHHVISVTDADKTVSSGGKITIGTSLFCDYHLLK
jgi:hypothetical protein